MENKKLYIYSAIGLGLTALAVWFLLKDKEPAIDESTIIDESIPLPPSTPTFNPNLVLLKGSKGQEVIALQKLMSITADGIFGTQTETRLFNLKGVRKASINQYKALPTINTNAYPNGTKVMANINPSTSTWGREALQKADGSFYSTYVKKLAFDYGDEIGVVKGRNGTGSWYLVEYTGWSGNRTVYFVPANEVKKF